MIELDATTSAQSERSVSALQWLIQADFTVGTQFWTTWPLDVTVDGQAYLGGRHLLNVAPIKESEDSSAERLVISLDVVNSALIAACLADPSGYRDKPIRLYGQFFGANYQPVGSPIHRWTGRMDKVSIPRDGQSRIELQCTRAGMARARNYQGLRLTDAQQKARYPGDRGLERMQKLIEEPKLWLSKAFQAI